MSTPTFTDVLRVEVAALQAQYPERLGEIARAHAGIVEGHVVDLGDGNGKVLSRDLSTWYTTNGVCTCQAAAYGKRCRHLSMWKLYQHVARKLAAQQAPEAPVEPGPEAPPMLQGIPKEHIVTIQGRPYIKLAGLLWLAHKRGLMELRTTWTYNDADLSLAHAVAVFPFGTYEESGDATVNNVNKKVAPHFRRCALSRASARCLRMALDIDMVSVEEMMDE